MLALWIVVREDEERTWDDFDLLVLFSPEIVDSKQNGIYAFEASSLEVEKCRFSGNKGQSVSICMYSIGTARARVSKCVMHHDRETTAVIIRTRNMPCNLDVLIEKNKMEDCDTGVIIWTRDDNEKASRSVV